MVLPHQDAVCSISSCLSLSVARRNSVPCRTRNQYGRVKNRFQHRDDGDGSEQLSLTSACFGDALDQTFVQVPCYEPAGTTVSLSGRDLCSHVALLGASGSGKTGVARWFIQQLIAYKPASGLSPGVFVFDFNDDGTTALVRRWAKEAGRTEDIRILSSEE